MFKGVLCVFKGVACVCVTADRETRRQWWCGVKTRYSTGERERQTHIDVSLIMVCSCSLTCVAMFPSVSGAFALYNQTHTYVHVNVYVDVFEYVEVHVYLDAYVYAFVHVCTHLFMHIRVVFFGGCFHLWMFQVWN